MYLEPEIWTGPGDQSQLIFGDGKHAIITEFGNGTVFFDSDQFRFFGPNVKAF